MRLVLVTSLWAKQSVVKRYGLIQLIQYQLYQILVYHTTLKEDERGESCTLGI